MILIDAGPLVALNDPRDSESPACITALKKCPPGKFATTWACIAEAMYFLSQSGGFTKQKALWQNWRDGTLEICDLAPMEVELAAELMERYQDLPMDLADATLVAIADCRGWRKVFTLDTHFFAYRLRDGSALDVILPAKA